MKVGTLVQFTAYNVKLGIGVVLRHDDEKPDYMWVSNEKMGPQFVPKDCTMLEVLSEAR